MSVYFLSKLALCVLVCGIFELKVITYTVCFVLLGVSQILTHTLTRISHEIIVKKKADGHGDNFFF